MGGGKSTVLICGDDDQRFMSTFANVVILLYVNQWL